MSYYPDLTPYNYHHYSEKELNVGWLEKKFEFSKGEVPAGFVDNLKIYFELGNTFFHYHGSHDCHFCEHKGNSSKEIRVVSNTGQIYASPEGILHYIEKHNYLPPQEFIDAVMTGPKPGSDLYKSIIALMPTFWKQRKQDTNDEDYEAKIQNQMVQDMAKSIDQEIIQDLLKESPELKKFIQSYEAVMPAVIGLKKKSE